MDLRNFIKELAKYNELLETEVEVDWDVEAAAIIAKSIELQTQAILFKNVRDFPGFSLFGGIYAGPGLLYATKRKPWTRMAIGISLDPYVRGSDFMGRMTEAIERPVLPIEVEKGPVKDVVKKGTDAKCTEFPIPKVNPQDGGRYLNLGIIIAKDPATGKHVIEPIRRFMVKDPYTLTGPLPAGIRRLYIDAEKAGKPLEVAVALGVSPSLTLASYLYQEMSSYPWMLHTAYDIAGGLDRVALELIKAETADLMIPAMAEIVIEGEIPAGLREEEGPYLDWNRLTEINSQPVIKIKVIEHRENPILPITVAAIKKCDIMNLLGWTHSFRLRDAVNHYFGAEVCKWIYVPPETRLSWCIASCPRLFTGQEHPISRVIFTTTYLFDKLLLIDDGIGMEEIPRAVVDLLQKASPVHSWKIVNYGKRRPESARYVDVPESGAYIYINAILEPSWPEELLPIRCSIETTWPKDLMENVRKKWKEWGFAKEPVRREIYK